MKEAAMPKQFCNRAIALLVAWTFVAPATYVDLHGQAAAASSPPSAGTSPPEEVDGGWPRAYVTAANAQLVLYQPQVASWDGQAKMVAYAAVSYQPNAAEKPALGTIRIESTTSVWVDDRLVQLS